MQYNIVVTKAIREIIWENVSSLGFLRKRARVFVRLHIQQERENNQPGRNARTVWRHLTDCDSSVQQRRRDRQFPGISAAFTILFTALPKTRAGTTTRLTGHRACVTAIRRSRRTSRRRGYRRLVKRALDHRCFFISIYLLGTLHWGLARLGTAYRRNKFKRLNCSTFAWLAGSIGPELSNRA